MADPGHPRHVLLGAQAGAASLPVCDHYSGVEARMRKSLDLQAQMAAEFGTCVFDVTLDCEDGAPVGAEAAHAKLVADLVEGARAGGSGLPPTRPIDRGRSAAESACAESNPRLPSDNRPRPCLQRSPINIPKMS